MWKLKLTSQFKKDYKRIQNQPEKLKALDAVLSDLAATGTVPQEYLPILFLATGPTTWSVTSKETFS